MHWKTVDQEMCYHLGVSQEVMQNMTDEEYTRANFQAWQEGVRRSVKDKHERKLQLKVNKYWFKKSMREIQKNKSKETADHNNNTIKWVQPEPAPLFYNEKGEEISDWDDQRWDELNAWTF